MATPPRNRKMELATRLELIRAILLSSAAIVQNAGDAVHQNRGWRTDDLADSLDEIRRAARLLSELL